MMLSRGPGPGAQVKWRGARVSGLAPERAWTRPNPCPAPWTPSTWPGQPLPEPPLSLQAPPSQPSPHPRQSPRAPLTASTSGGPPQGHKAQWSSGTRRAGLGPIRLLHTCLLTCDGPTDAMPPRGGVFPGRAQSRVGGKGLELLEAGGGLVQQGGLTPRYPSALTAP